MSQMGLDFQFEEKKQLEFKETLVSMTGGLLERNHMIVIDLQNNFYRIDIEKPTIISKSEKRQEGSYGHNICVMNSREQNFLACAKWTFEENQIEIRNCVDFGIALKFHVRSHINYISELKGNHKMRGNLIAGFADGTCGIYKVNI